MHAPKFLAVIRDASAIDTRYFAPGFSGTGADGIHQHGVNVRKFVYQLAEGNVLSCPAPAHAARDYLMVNDPIRHPLRHILPPRGIAPSMLMLFDGFQSWTASGALRKKASRSDGQPCPSP